MCTEKLFLSTQIALPAYQKVNHNHEGGEDTDSQHNTSSGAIQVYTYHLVLTAGYKVSDKTGFFCTTIFDWGRQ